MGRVHVAEDAYVGGTHKTNKEKMNVVPIVAPPIKEQQSTQEFVQGLPSVKVRVVCRH